MKRFSILWFISLIVISSGCGKNKYRHSSPEDYYEAAQKALGRKKCYQAGQLFRNLLTDYPGSHLVDDAQYGLGQSYQCQKDYVSAIFEYERLLHEYPVSPFTDEAQYQIGECNFLQARDIHHDQVETFSAIQEFERFVEDFPESELVPKARARILDLRSRLAEKELMIAQNYIKWNYPLAAKRVCEEILENYGDTEMVEQTKFELAKAQHKLGDLEEALETLTLLAGNGASGEFKKDIIEETEKVQEAIIKRGPNRVQ